METWKDFELASSERLWEGWAVAAHLSLGAKGAAYLLGYVAEMCLKAAFFRARNTSPHADIWSMRRVLLAAANQQSHGKYGAPEAFHDLDALCDALVWEQKNLGRPLGELESELRQHVAMLSRWWSVRMRYQPGSLSEKAVAECWNGADWLKTNYPLLY